MATYPNQIHNDDKEAIRSYVNRICAIQEAIFIMVSFKKIEGYERCYFNINGKGILKDSLDEAICFLDGIWLACEVFQFYVPDLAD